MKFFTRLVIILAALALTAAVVTWHFTMVLSSPQSVDTALAHGDAYAQTAKQLQSRLHDDINNGTDKTLEATLNAAIDQVVTPERMRTSLRPALNNLTEWLNSTSSDPPDVTVSTATLKDAIATQAEQTVAVLTSTQLRFELTRVLPDSITLSGSENRTDEGLVQSLQNLRQNYQQLKQTWPIEALAALILIASLFLLGLKRKRLMARRPAAVFLLAAVFVALLSYPLRFILSNSIFAVHSSSNNQAVASVVKSLVDYSLSSLLPIAVVLAIIGVVLLVVSFFLPRPKDEIKL